MTMAVHPVLVELKQVVDRDSMIGYLRTHCFVSPPEHWEAETAVELMESIIQGIEDVGQVYHNLGWGEPDNPWELLAFAISGAPGIE